MSMCPNCGRETSRFDNGLPIHPHRRYLCRKCGCVIDRATSRTEIVLSAIEKQQLRRQLSFLSRTLSPLVGLILLLEVGTVLVLR